MGYSIGQVAEKMGLTAHTLRYYEKEGLLPFVKKTGSGLRIFSDEDIGWLQMIECLKGTGMPLKGIKQYIDWYIEGDATLEKIDYKISLYTEAVRKGKLDAVSDNAVFAAERKRLFGSK